MQPTIRDVARHAETSVSTVSRVLTRQGPVAEATRERIMAAIEALGYQPNALARGLVQKRTGAIGVVLPDVTNPFCTEVLRGMGDAASAHGYHLLLVHASLSFARESEGVQLLQEKQVDGVIYTSGVVTPRHRELFRRLRRPVALAATWDEEGGFPGVVVDGRRGASMAMEYLAGLGHRRVAVLTGPLEDTVSGQTRWMGYQEGAERLGIPLRAQWVAHGDYRLESGYRAMTQILRGTDRPSALAAASDMMAVGAMTAAQDLGLRVPEDLAVVGFDNIWLAAAVRPALTTIAQPLYDMGRKTVDKLVAVLGGREVTETEWIEPHLVERQSTGPARE